MMYRFINVYIYSTLKLIPHTGFGRETLVSLWPHPWQPKTDIRPLRGHCGCPIWGTMGCPPSWTCASPLAVSLRAALQPRAWARRRWKAVFQKLVVFLLMHVTFSYIRQSPNSSAGASVAVSATSTWSWSSCEAPISARGRFLFFLGDFGNFAFFSTGGDACMAWMQYSRLPLVNSTSRPASFTDRAL